MAKVFSLHFHHLFLQAQADTHKVSLKLKPGREDATIRNFITPHGGAAPPPPGTSTLTRRSRPVRQVSRVYEFAHIEVGHCC